MLFLTARSARSGPPALTMKTRIPRALGSVGQGRGDEPRSMTRLFRILIGTFLGIVMMSVAVYLVERLAMWAPFPMRLWRTHPILVSGACEAIAFAPTALLLGIVLNTIFQSSRIVNSILSMAIALALGFAGSLIEQHVTLASLVEMPGLAIAFLVGVPAIVSILERPRA